MLKPKPKTVETPSFVIEETKSENLQTALNTFHKEITKHFIDAQLDQAMYSAQLHLNNTKTKLYVTTVIQITA